MDHMQVRNGSFCIVASTLPVGFLVGQFESLRIKKIFVMSKDLEQSYLSLKERKDPSIDVVKVPAGILRQSIFFLFVLLQARLSGTSVVIFHECCLPILDLLLNWIKPSGYYLPQVTMSGWQEIDFRQFPKGKMAAFLKVLGVTQRFKYYRSSPIGGNESEYVVSIKGYPRSIATMSVGFSREVLANCRSCGSRRTNKILFITGKSSASGDCQRKTYSALIEMAHAKGYVCHIKDHPNPAYRLDLSAEGAVTIDPLLPAELLESDYYLAVGVSSSALLSFDDRSVSLINLLDDMSPEDRHAYVRHFEGAMPGNKINYVRSADEFRALL